MLASCCRLALLGTLCSAAVAVEPAALIDFLSDDGERLLVEAEAREAYFPLASHFVTQENRGFCGVASMTMLLNALEVSAPEVPELSPYRTFTQANVLDDRTEAVLPREAIRRQGMSLDQLGAMLETKPLAVKVRHASESTVGEFRATAKDYLSRPDHFVLVNYLRAAIGQESGGHHSPLAAYHGGSDRFLILDTARYKYPPVWVRADDLFAAMNTRDAASPAKTRGYVLVSRK